MFEQLPHPWLVVDDSHENLDKLIPFVASYMTPGDYYVLEDVLIWQNSRIIADMVDMCRNLGFLVDSKYTDAFGVNVTCSPNGWLVKQ
jgi:hypothetical protein